MFVEEPVLPGNVAALKEISRATSIPIATGERLFTRWEFQEVVEQQAVAIIQPDLSHCGGISEARAHDWSFVSVVVLLEEASVCVCVGGGGQHAEGSCIGFSK